MNGKYAMHLNGISYNGIRRQHTLKVTLAACGMLDDAGVHSLKKKKL